MRASSRSRSNSSPRFPERPATVAPTEFSWNYTTFLNIAFLLVLAGLWWLARNQQRLGGGAGYAIDPVCGMQVETANAAAHSEHGGQTFWFCCDHCRHRFEADPERYDCAAEKAVAERA